MTTIIILICDDHPVLAEDLGKLAASVFADRDIRAEVHICNTAADFRCLSVRVHPDLILMDLSLGDDDGYRLVQEYRQTGGGAEVAFITSFAERMPQAFEHRPIGFLVKPFTAEQLSVLADRYLFYHSASRCYRLEKREGILNVPLSSIRYFESTGHSVLIHHTPGVEPYRQIKRLDDIAFELSDAGLLRIHKSYLVNPRFIAGISTADLRLLLHGGTELPISRRHYADTLRRVIELQSV